MNKKVLPLSEVVRKNIRARILRARHKQLIKIAEVVKNQDENNGYKLSPFRARFNYIFDINHVVVIHGIVSRPKNFHEKPSVLLGTLIYGWFWFKTAITAETWGV